MANPGSSAVLERNSRAGEYAIAVPSSVRMATGLKEGDTVAFTVTPDGRTIMRPKTGPLRDLRGATPSKIRATDRAIRNARAGVVVLKPG